MNENAPAVAVVILCWNGKKFLEKFLSPLLKTTYSNVSFYVADNASTDDSVDFVKTNFPTINVIRIEKNEGFAQGYNVALSLVKADYYVLLNQDVEVTPAWIEPVIDLMEADNIAICQPKIRAFYEKDQFEYAGAAGGFIDRFGYAFCRGRFFQKTESDRGQYDKVIEIVWATGACLFIRSEIFHTLGGFDADYFAHFEEIDLCWRVKNAGYSIKCCPHSTVYHVGGGSLPQGNPKKTYLNYRNNLVTIVKNVPGNKVYMITIIRLFLDVLPATKFLLTGKWKDYQAIAKAHIHFFRSLSRILKKRKSYWEIINRNKIGPPNMAGFYKKSIITDHYIKGTDKFSELSEADFY